MEKRIPLNILEDFCRRALVGAGVPESDAAIVADVLITSDRYGIDSHGINRLKGIYLDRIRDGILNPVTEITVVRDRAATALLDGNNGMGHVVSHRAMAMCIEKAKTYGMGMVAVRNSSHYGIAGYYGVMAADAGMIGITGTNARPSVAPTFGVENMLGTNPLTFVMPSDEPFPFFLDCATSVSQRGKFEYYAKNGLDLPHGWAIDRSGESKTNSAEVLEDLIAGRAALAPLGGVGEENAGYKGYGYATVVEILSAALQSGPFLSALTGMENGKKVPYRLGHFFIAIDIEHFTEIDQFKKTTGDILRELRNSEKMPGAERIFTAGEKEYLASLDRTRNGVVVNDTLLKELKQIAMEWGVGFEAVGF